MFKIKDINNIEFGSVFTDHMFIMDWDSQNGWSNARIEPYKPFVIDPSSIHLHYGMEIFEGMKAYKSADDKVFLFRPTNNFNRMNDSAKRICMPEIDVHFVLEQLKLLVKNDQDWIPNQKGTSLYIRPTMIATENTINLRPSKSFKFFIIMSPVGAIYKEGFNPVPILVSEKYTRSSIGGVGNVKTGGNYAASMLAQKEAKDQGFSQVLWLDPVHRRNIEEVGAMNIFFVIDGELVTPQLTGTILPGITRDSVIKLAQSLGYKVCERQISIDELTELIENKRCSEIFGTGTAAVISPVGKIKYKDKEYTINNNQTGDITKTLFNTLTGIQQGSIEDKFDWVVQIK